MAASKVKVKVTSPRKFEFLPFSKPISSAIYNWSWQMTTNFQRAGFSIFVLVFVSRDSELDQNLSGDLRKKISSDLNEIWYVEVALSDARRYAVWPEPRSTSRSSLKGSRPSVPHGTNNFNVCLSLCLFYYCVFMCFLFSLLFMYGP